MHTISTLLHKFRLLTSFLALVLLLGALAVTPASTDDFIIEGETCENGCIGWNQQNGCVVCQRCCVNDSGANKCWQVSAGSCS